MGVELRLVAHRVDHRLSGSTRAMATSKVSLVIPLRCASVRSSARQAEKSTGHGRNALRGSEGGKTEEC